MREILRDLMLTPAPSGYEHEMAKKMKALFLRYCEEVRIDRVGNVIAKIPGRDPSLPRLMVFGHMDQLGFVVRRIDGEGFIQVDRLGGIPEKVLPALAVIIRDEEGNWHPGVFGSKAHHATPPEEKYKVDPVTALYVDIGASSADEVRALGIEVGCPVIYRPGFEAFGEHRVSGTAVDNRGACTVLADLARRLSEEPPAGDVYLVGTVWEEFNLRGAMLAARSVHPDIALSLDVALASDTKDLATRFDDRMGEGPTVHLYSFHGRGTLNGTIAPEPVFRLAKESAAARGIRLQRFATTGILTDSAYIQLEDEGVLCLEMGFPARYTHTPIEMCDLRDLSALSEVVAEMARRIDGSFPLCRYGRIGD